MAFREWWCDESRSDEDNRHIGYEYAKEAWDYQQQRIDELEAFVRDVANCNYDYPELKAQDLLAQEGE